jgi:site-specific recombinase XerD
MASIHESKKSPYWQICYRGPNGKIVWRSSKTKDSNEAADVARELQDAADEARQKSGLSPARARTLVKELIESSGGEQRGLLTVRELLKTWLDRKKGSKTAKNSIESYENYSRKFCEFLGPRADEDAGLVKSSDAEAFHNWLKEIGLTPKTAGGCIKVMRSVYAYAVNADELDRNPFKVVELNMAGSIQKRPFTEAEIGDLLKAAEGEWRGLVLMGYCTGARLQNCARINFEDINWKEESLSYQPVKQRTSTLVPKILTIPILPELMAYFKSVGSEESRGPVLPELSKRKIGGHCGLSLQFRNLMHKAGLKWKCTEPKPGGRAVHELGFHSLRHTLNSRLANAGVSQEVRQKIIGHVSKEVNDIYTHIDLPLLRTEMEKLKKPQDK